MTKREKALTESLKVMIKLVEKYTPKNYINIPLHKAKKLLKGIKN